MSSGHDGRAGRAPRERMPLRPLLVGHRGAAAVAPENTVRAFRRGVAAGADLLECDVHRSADGQDVILHDATLDRTAEETSPLRHGNVASFTRAQLDTVRVGEGEHLPRLAEVLDAAARPEGGPVPVLVEVKAPAVASLVVRELGERFGAEAFADPAAAPAWVISFHAEALRTVQAEAPEIPRLLTAHVADDALFADALDVGARQVGLRIAEARDQDVRRCLELGLELNLWTARTEEALERALELGCDTLTVDDPAWARALLDADR